MTIEQIAENLEDRNNRLTNQLSRAVQTLEFIVASSNCIPDAAKNTGRAESELWAWFHASRDASLMAKRVGAQ
jgi:hypothetical protein